MMLNEGELTMEEIKAAVMTMTTKGVGKAPEFKMKQNKEFVTDWLEGL